MEQLKSPNLAVVGQPEECLVYVREVFGVGAKYPTATTGWNGTQYKHAGEQPPTDVSVPVWFSWQKDGHVAVSVPGKGIYSTSAKGDKVFPNIQALLSFMGGGVKYLGWSEDVDGVRVVQPAPAPQIAITIRMNPGAHWNVRTSPTMGNNIRPDGYAIGGQEYSAQLVNGWAQISFKGKVGYVGPATFTRV